MKKIEIVSHCYAAELPQFAAHLVHQVSGLVLHRPKLCEVRLSICVRGFKRFPENPLVPWRLHDPNLAKILPWLKKTLLENGIEWSICYMTKGEIGRRCVGRNLVAKTSDADVVWFSDVDYVFRDGVLDRLAEMEWPKSHGPDCDRTEVMGTMEPPYYRSPACSCRLASMIYPREIAIHRDHATGDARSEAVDLENPRLIDLDPSEFVPKRMPRAIGGVQIVRGDFAREHGYLHADEKWQRPAEKPFADFRDDLAYRRFCQRHGPIVAVDLPGVYRIRHTRTTYQ